MKPGDLILMLYKYDGYNFLVEVTEVSKYKNEIKYRPFVYWHNGDHYKKTAELEPHNTPILDSLDNLNHAYNITVLET